MRRLVGMKARRTGPPRWFLAATISMVALCAGYHPTAVTGQALSKEVLQVVQSSWQSSWQSSAGQQTPAGAAEQSPAHKYFTDVVLVNQNGEKMRFYSDLLQGKVVIINAFFATCQGSCLPMNRNLEKVQQALGDRFGKDVFIVSISVDPTVDTPASLKEYAKKLHARSGWYFLTGEKQNVDFALNKVGQFVTDKQDHLNIFIIGNERTGLWKKAFGLAQSDELVKVVESVLNDKPADAK
jgi:protein SCO1/2